MASALRAAGLCTSRRTPRREKINAKIRSNTASAHVPLILAVVGRKEAEERTVALRRLGGEAQETLPLAEAVSRLATEATPPDLR